MKRRKITSDHLNITKRKLPHWQIGGSWYFVTFRAKTRGLSPEARAAVAETILHDHKVKCDLALAVVMPDHVHILLKPLRKVAGDFYSLEEILRPIKGVSSRKVNRLAGTKRGIWQTESFDRIVRNEEEWREKYRYIQNNPVTAGLAESPEEYPWLLESEGLVNHW